MSEPPTDNVFRVERFSAASEPLVADKFTVYVDNEAAACPVEADLGAARKVIEQTGASASIRLVERTPQTVRGDADGVTCAFTTDTSGVTTSATRVVWTEAGHKVMAEVTRVGQPYSVTALASAVEDWPVCKDFDMAQSCEFA